VFVTPMAAQVVKRLPEGDDWMHRGSHPAHQIVFYAFDLLHFEKTRSGIQAPPRMRNWNPEPLL